jgi:cytoskeletal protein CcmA (bactofilin family)
MKRILVALVLLCALAPAAPALAASDSSKERIVIVGAVTVDRHDTSKDVVVVDGDVLIRGTVRGDVIAVDGDVTIRGKVTGDVTTVAGTARLGRRARVGGDLTYFDHKPVVARGAKIDGKTKKFDNGKLTVPLGVAAIGFWLAVSLSALVLGLLLLLLAPRAGEAIAKTAKTRLGPSIGVGILAFILLPILGVLACVTILGLPFGVGLLAALFPLYAIAYVTTAFFVGRLIRKSARIGAFVVGLVILRLLALIPFVGGLFGLIAIILGLGLLFMTLLRVRKA